MSRSSCHDDVTLAGSKGSKSSRVLKPSHDHDFKLAGPMGSKDEIQKILSKYRVQVERVSVRDVQMLPPGEIISVDLGDRDEQLVIKALKYHPHAHQKIGCGISKVVVGRRIAKYGTDVCCFFVVRKDGSKEDFSYNTIFGKRNSSSYSLETDSFAKPVRGRGRGSYVAPPLDARHSGSPLRSNGPPSGLEISSNGYVEHNSIPDSWDDDDDEAETSISVPYSWDLDD